MAQPNDGNSLPPRPPTKADAMRQSLRNATSGGGAEVDASYVQEKLELVVKSAIVALEKVYDTWKQTIETTIKKTGGSACHMDLIPFYWRVSQFLNIFKAFCYFNVFTLANHVEMPEMQQKFQIWGPDRAALPRSDDEAKADEIVAKWLQNKAWVDALETHLDCFYSKKANHEFLEESAPIKMPRPMLQYDDKNVLRSLLDGFLLLVESSRFIESFVIAMKLVSPKPLREIAPWKKFFDPTFDRMCRQFNLAASKMLAFTGLQNLQTSVINVNSWTGPPKFDKKVLHLERYRVQGETPVQKPSSKGKKEPPPGPKKELNFDDATALTIGPYSPYKKRKTAGDLQYCLLCPGWREDNSGCHFYSQVTSDDFSFFKYELQPRNIYAIINKKVTTTTMTCVDYEHYEENEMDKQKKEKQLMTTSSAYKLMSQHIKNCHACRSVKRPTMFGRINGKQAPVCFCKQCTGHDCTTEEEVLDQMETWVKWRRQQLEEQKKPGVPKKTLAWWQKKAEDN